LNLPTINRSVKNKAVIWVVEAFEYVIGQFPFPILGIDSDNESEFINHHLFEYFTEHKITFTRSRSGNKNSEAHIEQKNWTHVRELVGYLRFDTEKELSVLIQIWALDMAYTNYLLAQQKIVFKHRNASKVTKRYDRATTPFARATARASVDGVDRKAMQEVMAAIRPREPLPEDSRPHHAAGAHSSEQGSHTGQTTGEGYSARSSRRGFYATH